VRGVAGLSPQRDLSFHAFRQFPLASISISWQAWPIRVNVLDHPATAAVLLARPTAWGVHDAVKRNKPGIDQITHPLLSLWPGDEVAV